MGYLLFESSETGFKTGLTQLHDAIQETGAAPDGATHIEVIVRGATEKRVTFAITQPEELLEILKLNSD